MPNRFAIGSGGVHRDSTKVKSKRAGGGDGLRRQRRSLQFCTRVEVVRPNVLDCNSGFIIKTCFLPLQFPQVAGERRTRPVLERAGHVALPKSDIIRRHVHDQPSFHHHRKRIIPGFKIDARLPAE